ncbi:MAG: RND family transporter [bacterium]|nr:RND family transporter [bacterium]
MNKIADFIVKFRWPIVIFFLVVTAGFALQLSRAEVETDIKKQLPDNMPSRLVLDKIEDIFGGTDMAMVIIMGDDILEEKTLKRVKKISRKLKRVKGVDKVLSLFELKEIKGEDGAMIVNPAVDKIPKNAEDRELLRQRLKDNDLVYGMVVGKEFKATAIIGMLTSNAADTYVAEQLRKIVLETPGTEKVVFGGMPYIRASVGTDIKGDMRKFMPAGLFIMLIFLFACFRQLRGVILPFIVVVMAIIVTMGLVPILGWKIHIITVLLPVILLAIANDYGIHLMSKYQEDNIEGNSLSKEDLARNVFLGMGKPVLATGVTTMAGMLCLMAHIIVPAEQMGVLASAGIFFALLASLLFIPALLAIFPKAKPVIKQNVEEGHIFERMLHRMARFVSGKPKAIIIVAVLAASLVGMGTMFIVVDTNPENYYTHESPIVEASKIVNEKFGGSNAVSIIVKGDIKEPAVMKRIDAFEKELKAMPEVGNTTSLGRVVRQMSRALHDKDEPGYDTIPHTRNAVAQYFELYSMSGDPDDFEKLVDFPYEHSQVSARINSVSSEVIKKAVTTIKGKIEGDPLFKEVGGFAAIFSELVDEVVKGQIISLFISLLVVALLVMLLFRSPTAGILAVIPLGLSLLLLFGLMGYAKIELNVVTALLSSIMVGVGIDYTIHFLWRYKEERGNGLEPVAAVEETLVTAGRGIIFNALSVIIGFVVLLLSNFMPVKFFGFLVVVTISTCLLGALVLLPALCILIRPKFLEPNVKL